MTCFGLGKQIGHGNLRSWQFIHVANCDRTKNKYFLGLIPNPAVHPHSTPGVCLWIWSDLSPKLGESVGNGWAPMKCRCTATKRGGGGGGRELSS